jgi:hypothetical protein
MHKYDKTEQINIKSHKITRQGKVIELIKLALHSFLIWQMLLHILYSVYSICAISIQITLKTGIQILFPYLWSLSCIRQKRKSTMPQQPRLSQSAIFCLKQKSKSLIRHKTLYHELGSRLTIKLLFMATNNRDYYQMALLLHGTV